MIPIGAHLPKTECSKGATIKKPLPIIEAKGVTVAPHNSELITFFLIRNNPNINVATMAIELNKFELLIIPSIYFLVMFKLSNIFNISPMGCLMALKTVLHSCIRLIWNLL